MSAAAAMMLGTGRCGRPVQSPAFVGTVVVLGRTGAASGQGDHAWLSPKEPGGGSRFWVRVTRTGGTQGVTFSPSPGVWRSLANGVTFSASGAGSASGTIEFASDASGQTIVSTGTISVSSAA